MNANFETTHTYLIQLYQALYVGFGPVMNYDGVMLGRAECLYCRVYHDEALLIEHPDDCPAKKLVVHIEDVEKDLINLQVDTGDA